MAPILTSRMKEACEICFKNDGFIAGGYAAHKADILKTFSDVDFFFPKESALLSAAQDIVTKFGPGPLVQEEFGASFKDIISLNATGFGTPVEVTHEFDLNVARYVIIKKLMNKPIYNQGDCVNRSLSKPHASRCWRRLLKYMRRVWPSKRALVVGATKEFLDLYGTTFDPCYVVGTSTYNGTAKISKTLQKLAKIAGGRRFGTVSGKIVNTMEEPTAFVRATRSKCSHTNVKHYNGLTDAFDYCGDCNAKLPVIDKAPKTDSSVWNDEVPF